MFSFDVGIPIAEVFDDEGSDDGEILRVTEAEDDSEGDEYMLTGRGFLEPIMDPTQRSISYIAGPSGSGKSTVASKLARGWMRMFPGRDVYFISRTSYKDDSVWRDLKLNQIIVDESLYEEPIDITQDIQQDKTLIIFDDVTTIQNDKMRKAVEKMIADILEVGRKLNIWIIVTSHLVIGNDKKLSRTIMNEMQSLYVFPKSGSSQQIKYALKQYFGLSNDQIERIIRLKSRWVRIQKTSPQYVLYDCGAYIL
jgi:adenylate kinase family enzyme